MLQQSASSRDLVMHETVAVRAAGIWEWAVRESASDENRIFLGLPCVNGFPTSYIPLTRARPPLSTTP